ncbi:MAG: Trm112 family protein [Candidatus Coatesbacteria bacterium]|nr:Trm112 family protein [Candidatus Coatesbacteria bacterium]
MLSEKLLAILACPKCKGGLDYKPDLNQLICNNCRLIYKIEDDIPNMIIEEAEPLK